MATKTEATLVDDTEAILGDSSNAIFSAADDVQPAVLAAFREVSIYKPYKVNHWLTSRRRSKYIDVSTITDLIEPNYAIYPIVLIDTDSDLIDDGMLDYNRRNIEWEDETLRMNLDYAPYEVETNDLTGTVTFNSGSTAVSGSGTAFLTELRVGYYINPSSSQNWYRVASITDATNLVLANNCIAADAGADTSTNYWRNDVVVNCDKVHFSTAQADLAGAVKLAHAKGVWSITIDGLTDSQIVTKNTTFTIAGVDGAYRSTSADKTVASNEVTITIEPALMGIAPDNAIVTFRPTSLTPQLERIVTEIAAARLCINWVYNARTQYDSVETDITALNTELILANPEVDLAKTHVASAITLDPNTVAIGSDPFNTLANLASASNINAQGYLGIAMAIAQKINSRVTAGQYQLALRNVGHERLAYVLADLRDTRTPKLLHQYSSSGFGAGYWRGW